MRRQVCCPYWLAQYFTHNSTFVHDWLMRFGCRNMEYRNVCQRIVFSVFKTHYIYAHLPVSYIAFVQKGLQLCTFATVLYLLCTNWYFILHFKTRIYKQKLIYLFFFMVSRVLRCICVFITCNPLVYKLPSQSRALGTKSLNCPLRFLSITI